MYLYSHISVLVPISHPSLGKGQGDVIPFILVMQLLGVKIAIHTCHVLNL